MRSPSSPTFLILSRLIAGSAILVSVLQGILFTTEALWTTHSVVAIGLAATNLFLAVRFLTTNQLRLLGLLVILYLAQLGLFGVKVVGLDTQVPMRLLQVAIVLLYFGAAASVLLVGTRIVAPLNALLLSFSLATGLFLGETALELLAPRNDGPIPPVPEWRWDSKSDWAVLQADSSPIHGPYSALKTYYPDNPRGYFEEEDARNTKWWLQTRPGNMADLVFSPSNSELVRISITKAETTTSWDIQLKQSHLKVKSHQGYTVNFRARADSPRTIIVGFARAYEPWTGLGLWKTIELTSAWQSFQEDFVATADYDNAFIHFNLGGSGASVEFSNVSLRSRPEGKLIEPDLPIKYFVGYRFNALGCRGRDYPMPSQAGTVRVLLLGDSITFGQGVHEEHTFAHLLERLLNEKAHSLDGHRRAYEVINCGVGGFSTRDERLFYERFGAKYKPDLVLLTMVFNDDLSFVEEVQRGYVNRRPGKFESLSYIWARVQEYRHKRPFPDFSRSVEELLRLASDVQKQDARLAVVIFRYGGFAGAELYGKMWNHLTKTVTEGLQGTDIPILDLGRALCETHKDCTQALAVHPMDFHPNEIAHAIAARSILNFLQTDNLLNRKTELVTLGSRQ